MKMCFFHEVTWWVVIWITWPYVPHEVNRLWSRLFCVCQNLPSVTLDIQKDNTQKDFTLLVSSTSWSLSYQSDFPEHGNVVKLRMTTGKKLVFIEMQIADRTPSTKDVVDRKPSSWSVPMSCWWHCKWNGWWHQSSDVCNKVVTYRKLWTIVPAASSPDSAWETGLCSRKCAWSLCKQWACRADTAHRQRLTPPRHHSTRAASTNNTRMRRSSSLVTAREAGWMRRVATRGSRPGKTTSKLPKRLTGARTLSVCRTASVAVYRTGARAEMERCRLQPHLLTIWCQATLVL